MFQGEPGLETVSAAKPGPAAGSTVLKSLPCCSLVIVHCQLPRNTTQIAVLVVVVVVEQPWTRTRARRSHFTFTCKIHGFSSPNNLSLPQVAFDPSITNELFSLQNLLLAPVALSATVTLGLIVRYLIDSHNIRANGVPGPFLAKFSDLWL